MSKSPILMRFFRAFPILVGDIAAAFWAYLVRVAIANFAVLKGAAWILPGLLVYHFGKRYFLGP